MVNTMNLALQFQMRVRHWGRLRVLQIDGGGLLGCVFFAQLRMLESTCPSGRICDAFDLIYGTSTGAIIGAALAAGASVDEVEALYRQHGKNIFTPKNSWWLPWRKITRPLYDRERVLAPLRALLQKYNVDYMGELKTRFVAVTVDECSRLNVFLKSWASASNMPVVEAVAQSFAALMYFGHIVDMRNRVCRSDGGTGTLNCSLSFAHIEAQGIGSCDERTLYGDGNGTLGIRGTTVSDIDIYSFGTGTVPEVLPFDGVRKWSLPRLLWNTFWFKGQGLARAQSASDQVLGLSWLIDKQLRAGVKPQMQVHLMRFDTPVPKNMDVMDGPKFIDQYFAIGVASATRNQARLRLLS
jgi:hypothetical protein